MQSRNLFYACIGFISEQGYSLSYWQRRKQKREVKLWTENYALNLGEDDFSMNLQNENLLLWRAKNCLHFKRFLQLVFSSFRDRHDVHENEGDDERFMYVCNVCVRMYLSMSFCLLFSVFFTGGGVVASKHAYYKAMCNVMYACRLRLYTKSWLQCKYDQHARKSLSSLDAFSA